MTKKLEQLGDRLLTRVVPKVVAEAGVTACTGVFCRCGKYYYFRNAIGVCEM